MELAKAALYGAVILTLLLILARIAWDLWQDYDARAEFEEAAREAAKRRHPAYRWQHILKDGDQ